jgi:hypothetical protein
MRTFFFEKKKPPQRRGQQKKKDGFKNKKQPSPSMAAISEEEQAAEDALKKLTRSFGVRSVVVMNENGALLFVCLASRRSTSAHVCIHV